MKFPRDEMGIMGKHTGYGDDLGLLRIVRTYGMF